MLELTDDELYWITVTLKTDIMCITDWDKMMLSKEQVETIIDKLHEAMISKELKQS